MSVAFDAVGPAGGAGTSDTASPLTWTHACGASATDLTVFVTSTAGTTNQVTGVTYNGAAMTFLKYIPSGNAGAGGIAVYYLANPAAGSNTVSVAHSGLCLGSSVSFTGGGSHGTAVSGFTPPSGSGVSASVPSTTSGGMIAAGVCAGTPQSTWTAANGGTLRFHLNVDFFAGSDNFAGGTWASAGGAQTVGINGDNADEWGLVAVEILPGATNVPQAFTDGGTGTDTLTAGAPGQFTERGTSTDALAVVVSQPFTEAGTGTEAFSTGPPFVAGVAGSGYTGYFADQSGKPRLLLFEMCWGLPGNAGRWNSGNWQADFDAYFAARSSQGYTGWWGVPWVNHQIDGSAPFTDGRSWDGIYPLTVNGTPGSITSSGQVVGLNDTYWQRIDYMIGAAARNGVTILLNMCMSYDTQAGWIFGSTTNTQAQQFGAAVAARYPQARYPNVQFVFGDDDFQANEDTFFQSILTGIRSTGDTRNAVTKEQYPETNCHVEFDTGAVYVPGGFGVTNCQFNFIYTYDPVYLGAEASYTESGTTPIPVVWGDGVWYGDTDNSTVEYTERRFVWWALSSGVRGLDVTDGPSQGGNVWPWHSSAVADLTSDPNGTFVTGKIGQIRSFFESLPGWHQLIPDTGSALVTSGRGTRATSSAPGLGTPANYGNTDNYVTASKTADGKLAVIYCAAHFSITIDQSQMVAGYTATWVDPSNPSLTQAAVPGSSYSSTARGNNAAGNPDWLLVLAAASSAVSQPFSESGAAADVLAVTVTAPLTVAGTGTDALTLTVPLPFNATGAGTDALALIQPAGLVESGAGSDAFKVAQPTALADSGSGADALVVSQTVAVALTQSGAGTDTFALGPASAVSLPEAGAGSEGLAVTAGMVLAEAASGSDGFTVTQPSLLTDSGTGADALTVSLVAVVSLSEAGAGADALAVQVVTPVALSEAGAGTDGLTVTAATGLTDNGHGTDTLTVQTGSVSLAEAAQCTDTLSVAATVGVGFTEAGAAFDVVSVAHPVAFTESGTGADAVVTSNALVNVLNGMAAGQPHGGWAAGDPHGGWAAGGPHGNWQSGEAHD